MSYFLTFRVDNIHLLLKYMYNVIFIALLTEKENYQIMNMHLTRKNKLIFY